MDTKELPIVPSPTPTKTLFITKSAATATGTAQPTPRVSEAKAKACTNEQISEVRLAKAKELQQQQQQQTCATTASAVLVDATPTPAAPTRAAVSMEKMHSEKKSSKKKKDKKKKKKKKVEKENPSETTPSDKKKPAKTSPKEEKFISTDGDLGKILTEHKSPVTDENPTTLSEKVFKKKSSKKRTPSKTTPAKTAPDSAIVNSHEGVPSIPGNLFASEVMGHLNALREDPDQDNSLGDVSSSTVRHEHTSASATSSVSDDTFSGFSIPMYVSAEHDEGGYSTKNQERKTVNDSAVFTYFYIAAIVFLVGHMWIYKAVRASLEDGHWIRLLWLLTLPPVIAMMMFPMKIIVVNSLFLLGSYRNVKRNSTHFSAIPPPVPSILPRVFVQMPVYKESFEKTIEPSLGNILKAVHFYRQQGGEADIFINDDGLMLISEEQREHRIAYYKKHGIAYVARPPPSVLERRGIFKKASNMNFCINFAMDVDKALQEEESQEKSDIDAAIENVIESRDYLMIAGGPVTFRDLKYILLVDSDTRVPKKCIYETVGEFALCPNLGYIQHAISVLRVENNYWEDWLAHFTDLLYNVYISMATANGELAPLVGHNATLSWEVMDEVSWMDESSGYRCWWSEAHVSEDFDMCLRMTSGNYEGRYVTYTGSGFKEGVSVTVFEEITKLKKYAYGAGEMLFNPLIMWPRHGILSPLMTKFLRSNVRFDHKMNMLAYMFTFVAMSWAIYIIPVSLYVSLLSDQTMHMQKTAFEIFVGIILVFAVIGNILTILTTFLMGRHTNLWYAIYTEAKWIPVVSLFFGGLPYHICCGFTRYMLSMRAEWGATIKDIDAVDHTMSLFFSELFSTIRRYWFMYVLVILYSVTLAGGFMTMDWLGWSGYAMAPFLCTITMHALMPVLLNPIAVKSLSIPFKNCFQRFYCCKQMWRRTPELDDVSEQSSVIKAHIGS